MPDRHEHPSDLPGLSFVLANNWDDGRCLDCGFEHEHAWWPTDDIECAICGQWQSYLHIDKLEKENAALKAEIERLKAAK